MIAKTIWITRDPDGLEPGRKILIRFIWVYATVNSNARAVEARTNIIMASCRPSKKLLLLCLAVFAFFALLSNFILLSGANVNLRIKSIPLPAIPGLPTSPRRASEKVEDAAEPNDAHPISLLMKEADKKWRFYEDNRSVTFRQTVSKYRRKYGRHPPPGFKEWYQYARERNVHNIDDFEQIMDDMRPFWAVEPRIMRNLAANMWKDTDQGVSGIHIRNHKIVNVTQGSWRSEIMVTLIDKFIKYLPDMDLASNRLDQPRVVVPWEDMQAHLAKELETRKTPPHATDGFTEGIKGILNVTGDDTKQSQEDPGWYSPSQKQYMDIATTACPPDSYARSKNSSAADAKISFKDRISGVITNFNRSTDLCTVGPELKDKHGFLYSSSSLIATKRLVPIFSECKVNINSDILFPANMYWQHDDRYDYNDKSDKKWEKKQEVMMWRGTTSGGTQISDNWQRMHRHRLVTLLNATKIEDKEIQILTEQLMKRGEYEGFGKFHPSDFARKHTDVGFSETCCCIPDCSIFGDQLSIKNSISFPQQFRYKFLVDVDGHSFSGRWRAFLESKSLGIKATIFREWHDSRLIAWRHFVPMDNQYDDIYTILTYFIGLGESVERGPGEYSKTTPYVARHDKEGKRIASQGREWAKKVLRREDIEVSLMINPRVF